MMKYCHKCKQEHPIEDFPLNEYGVPTSPCRKQRNARSARWRAAHPDYMKQHGGRRNKAQCQ